ncbi:MAG: hypothetical protein H6741_04810 [Alphaproteobacteria bacterium]|nr:hypothetical protein [Alphaproteobacteria bacterium]MCB9792029.1 hypothetical protein [Alphaproteobacteria bacterium]
MPETPPPSITDLAAQRVEQLVRPELWPRPTWLTADDVRSARRFEEHWASWLRDRYLELEARFLSLLGERGADPHFDRLTAGRVEEMLRLTRTELEDTYPELTEIHGRLDMVQRKLVLLLPKERLLAACMATASRLSAMEIGDDLRVRLDTLIRAELNPESLSAMRALLQEAERQITKHDAEEWLGGKLQISRLLAWRWWAFGLVFLLIALSPVLVQKTAMETYTLLLPEETLAKLPRFVPRDFTRWVWAFAVALFGASGAALSALLSVSRSRVNLREYEVNRVSLQLKVFIGALVALVALVLLSWGMLPGMVVTSTGSYLFVAFLSGFSERYFLRLLKVGEEDERKEAEDG